MAISKRYTIHNLSWFDEAVDKSYTHSGNFPSGCCYMLRIRIRRKQVQVLDDAEFCDGWEVDVPEEIAFQHQIAYAPPSCVTAQTDIASYISTFFKYLKLKQSCVNRIASLFAKFVEITPLGAPIIAVADVVECNIDYTRMGVLDDQAPMFDVEYKQELMAKFRNYVTDHMKLVKYDDCVPDETCVICCDAFKEGEEVARTACFHYFHAKCIDAWVTRKNNCPVCRCDME